MKGKLRALTWGVVVHLNSRHYAVAVAVPGLDHALAAPAITHGLAGFGQTGVKRGVADELFRPQVVAQLLSGDDAVAVDEEIGEQVEHFGAERDRGPGAAQLILQGIQGLVAEYVAHRPPPLTTAARIVAGKCEDSRRKFQGCRQA